MKILVSACLLGCPCRYDGKSKINSELVSALKKHEVVPFCPEIYGGLPTPRPAAEIKNGRVMTIDGRDVTNEYKKGADECVKLALLLNIEMCVLQDRSPSCGVGIIHNGDFDGGLVKGMGMTALALENAGIKAVPASEAMDLLR